MNTTLISQQCTCNQRKHHDQDSALFVFRENENSQHPFHFFI